MYDQKSTHSYATQNPHVADHTQTNPACTAHGIGSNATGCGSAPNPFAPQTYSNEVTGSNKGDTPIVHRFVANDTASAPSTSHDSTGGMGSGTSRARGKESGNEFLARTGTYPRSDFPGYSADSSELTNPHSDIWEPIGPNGVPAGNGMNYAPAIDSMMKFGPDPTKMPADLAPDYVRYIARHGKFAPACGRAPRARDVTDIFRFECEYFGDLHLPNGQKYIGSNPKIKGIMPDCSAGMSLDPISNETLGACRMLSAATLDPPGIAGLDPTMFQCSMRSNGWHSR